MALRVVVCYTFREGLSAIMCVITPIVIETRKCIPNRIINRSKTKTVWIWYSLAEDNNRTLNGKFLIFYVLKECYNQEL